MHIRKPINQELSFNTQYGLIRDGFSSPIPIINPKEALENYHSNYGKLGV